MKKKEQEAEKPQTLNEESSGWLKSIQLNSWEAELLISALFLYILFQIPDFLDTYRKARYDSGEAIFRLIGFFRDAVVILSIGYGIHIIARGIWVANIGLSNVFPSGVNLDRLKLKGRFRKEAEKERYHDRSVLRLERIASITYAVSFMCSGLMLSFGMIVMTLIIYIEWIFKPALESGNGGQYLLAILGLLFYLLILLIVFIDFLTNGYFRRDSWAARPYYYVAIVFRYLTLSFIYNRTLLIILSALPRWQAHAIPFLLVAFIVGYDQGMDLLDEREREKYYEGVTDAIRYENYENLRSDPSRLFVTIQNDVIEENVIRLFVNQLDEFSELYRRDTTRVNSWKELDTDIKKQYVQQYLIVKVDSSEVEDMVWYPYKHPVSYKNGYLAYLHVTGLSQGSHRLLVALDTVALQPRQLTYLKEQKPLTILQANIPFYLTK